MNRLDFGQIRASVFQGDRSNGVARQLKSLADSRNNKVSAENQEQAFQEGLQNGSTEELEQKKVPLLFGRKTAEAHNKGLQDAYVLGIERDNIEKINELQSQFSDDVDGFDKASEGLTSSLGDVDPLVQDTVQQSLGRMISQARLTVQRNNIRKDQVRSEAERKSAGDSFSREAFSASRNGDQEALEDHMFRFEASVHSRFETGDIDADERDFLLRDAHREVTEQSHLGNLSRQPIEEAVQNLDKLQERVPEGFTPDEWDSFLSRARQDVSQRLSAGKAERDARAKENQIRLDAFRDKSELGIQIDDSETALMSRLVAGTEDEKTVRDINALRSFAVLPKDQRDAALDNINIVTSGNPELAEMIHEANGKIQQEAERNGYGLAVDQGVIPGSELDLENLSVSIAERVHVNESLSQHYGVSVPILADAEADQIVSHIKTIPLEDRVALAADISGMPGSFGVFEQIAGKGQSVFAQAGAIAATGGVVAASSVLQGQEMIANGTAKKPTLNEYLDDFNGYVGNVYQGANREAVMQSAIAHYATKNNVSYDAGDFRESLKEVTGGVDEVNGGMVELPRGVKRRDLENYFEGFTTEMLARFGTVDGMTSDQAVTLIRDGVPRSVGYNQYQIDTNSGTIYGNNGEPLVISFDPKISELRQIRQNPNPLGRRNL